MSATLLGINCAQTLSVLLIPFSRRAFRRFNRFLANTWWGWCVIGGERILGTRVVCTGDEVPLKENAVVVANHQQMVDIPTIMAFARQKQRLGDLKWFVKRALRPVPGLGWGMRFLNCLFVNRNWTKDRELVQQIFATIVNERIPLWLVSFVEGTRVTPAKLEQSRDYARQVGVEPPNHVLLPRARGFVASVQALGQHITAVYDLTIGYVEGVPTLWQYLEGQVREIHLHVRRYAVDELPRQEHELAAWLRERFVEKDLLLERFYEGGCFPAAPAVED